MSRRTPKQNGTRAAAEMQIIMRHPCELQPCPDNANVYAAISDSDSAIVDLAKDIAKRGILQPLMVTQDDVVLSGHRRLAAARRARLATVPTIVAPLMYSTDRDKCLAILVAANRQRIKNAQELLNEELARIDPNAAIVRLRERRRKNGNMVPISAGAVVEHRWRSRDGIGKSKRQFVEAVQCVLDERDEFWPLSDRAVHYALLNNPPLRNAGRPSSRYTNDLASYKDLCKLLTKLRLEGTVFWEAIDDSTRPVELNGGWPNAQAFMRYELENLFWGYRRDLQRAQPAHVEVVAEKLTVQGILRPVCVDYGIPLTVCRGYPSLDARHKLVQRFRKTGKRRLVLLVATDHDPEGEDIATSIASSLRNDFGILKGSFAGDSDDPNSVDRVDFSVRKFALTAEQVKRFGLPPTMLAKQSSARYAKFAAKHGKHAYELEALAPAILQRALRDAIDAAINRSIFDAECEQEKNDAAFMEATRTRVLAGLKELGLDQGGVE